MSKTTKITGYAGGMQAGCGGSGQEDYWVVCMQGACRRANWNGLAGRGRQVISLRWWRAGRLQDGVDAGGMQEGQLDGCAGRGRQVGMLGLWRSGRLTCLMQA